MTSVLSDRTPRHLNRIELRDESACPGIELIERIAFLRRPAEEDLAILNAWKPKYLAVSA